LARYRGVLLRSTPSYCLASLRDGPNARKRAMNVLQSPLCRKLRPKLCRAKILRQSLRQCFRQRKGKRIGKWFKLQSGKSSATLPFSFFLPLCPVPRGYPSRGNPKGCQKVAGGRSNAEPSGKRSISLSLFPGGIAALNPRLLSGIPPGWPKRTEACDECFAITPLSKTSS
jgi:hypothetical protein